MKKVSKTIELESSSFRDPSGIVFYKDGVVFREVKQSYKNNYDILLSSGLYKKLIKEELMIEHEEVEDLTNKIFDDGYKTLKPEMVPLISYPYEWSFSQLKDAALLTLKIQRVALEHGMSLKDSNAYNVQFFGYKPKLIDILSFEVYKEGIPWVAYKQFCQHFLAPLTLMSKVDMSLNKMLRLYIDGLPLDLTCKLLPKRSFFELSTFLHLLLHNSSQKKYSNKTIDKKISNRKVSKVSMLALIDNLEKSVRKIECRKDSTEWGDYYNFTNYSKGAFDDKKKIVRTFIQKVKPQSVWDLGSNDGEFSRIASDNGIYTISYDIDPIAVEKNYLKAKKNKEQNLLPLMLDLTNPSPSIGWSNKERKSVVKRGPVDMVFALALIHHLAISNNLPFENIAKYFYDLTSYLVIEFVPKDDSKVKTLLSTREDIFNEYDKESFEKVFGRYFRILKKIPVKNSKRIMYLMKK